MSNDKINDLKDTMMRRIRNWEPLKLDLFQNFLCSFPLLFLHPSNHYILNIIDLAARLYDFAKILAYENC